MYNLDAEGVYNPFMAICGIVLIPVLVWWFRQKVSHTTRLFGFLLILFFAKGSLELLGIINTTILRYSFELPFVACYFFCLFKKKKRKSYGGRILITFFIAVSIISGIQTGAAMTVMFLLYVLEIFMMLFFFRNTFNWKESKLIHKLFILLASVQILASFIKFFLVGVTEPYIGTMSSHEGGITTLFALCTFCVSLEMFLCTRKRWILLLTLGFIFLGFIGGKRALAFFFPAFYIVTLIIHTLFNRTKMFSSRMIKMFVVSIIVVPLLFIGACILSPSLNPEHKIGGTFNFDYVINFTDEYNSGIGREDDSGRKNALPLIIMKLCSGNMYNFAFGYGSGTLVSSRYNIYDNLDMSNVERFGVGYSKGVGIVYMLIQVGFVGTLLYFGILISLLVDLIRKIVKMKFRLRPREKRWVISAILSLSCIIVISIIYNNTAFYLNPCSLMLFWLVAFAYKVLDKSYNIMCYEV